MARRRRSRRHSSGTDGGKVVAGVGILVLCGAILGGYGYLKMTAESAPVLVADTLCPEDGPQSATVVIFDGSTQLPAVTRAEIRTHLDDLARATPNYGLLEIRAIDPDVPGGRVVFSRCNPGDGSNLSELVANPALAKRRWSEEFAAPLEAEMDRLLDGDDAETSPIIETIQHVAAQRFAGHSMAGRDKRLVIFSDMMEHTPLYSQYGGTSLAYDDYLKTQAARALSTDLSGADVSIRYVRRLNARVDEGTHMEFWARWIDESNGRLAEAKKLQGAN